MKDRGWSPRHRGGLAPHWVALVCGLFATWIGAEPARATLAQDVDRLALVWGNSEQLERMRPRLVARGERIPLPLPSWSGADAPRGCTTLAFLSSPSVSFVVHFQPAAGLEPELSSIGWATLVRCGQRRAELQSIALEMRSPRGVVEMIVARSQSPLPSPGQILAHRDPGPSSESVPSGNAPVVPPLEQRIAAWQAQARRAGADKIESQRLAKGQEQVLTAAVPLDAGCHQLSALASQAKDGGAAPDLDLVLRGDAAELARRDQSENPDAELELCVGARRRAEALVLGLMPSDRAVLLHAQFPLPGGLPERWGSETRARFAEAFFRRRFRGQVQEPIYESLGIAGHSVLPLQLEVQTCYVAAVAVIDGIPKALLLDAAASDRDGSMDGTSTEPAIALGFCTGDEGLARIRVEAAGPSLVWLLALWRIERQERKAGGS